MKINLNSASHNFALSSEHPLQCRVAQPEDEEFLFKLFVAVRGPEFAVLALPEAMLHNLLTMQFGTQRASYRIQFPNNEQFILTLGDQPIGQFWVSRLAQEIRLLDIAILPDFQRRGIGTAVLRTLMPQAQPTYPLSLSVAMAEEHVFQWYMSLGFEMIGEAGLYRQMQWPTPSPLPEATPVKDD